MSLVVQYVEGDFPCAIVKHESLGTLCGYVGVPPCHPWYGKDYPNVDVHGGITYSDHEEVGHPTTIQQLEKRAENCQNLKPPMPRPSLWERILETEREHAGERRGYPCDTGQDVWWLGFDCSHLGDRVPGPENPSPELEASGCYPTDGAYRDETYVRREIERLVTQAADAMRQKVGATP